MCRLSRAWPALSRTLRGQIDFLVFLVASFLVDAQMFSMARAVGVRSFRMSNKDWPTRPAEIVCDAQPAVHLRPYVIDLEVSYVKLLGHLAVFATALRPLDDQLIRGIGVWGVGVGNCADVWLSGAACGLRFSPVPLRVRQSGCVHRARCRSPARHGHPALSCHRPVPTGR